MSGTSFVYHVLHVVRKTPRSALSPSRSSSLWIGAAATGLLQHMRSPQVARMVGMLAAVDGADDAVDAISELLQASP